MRVTQDTLIPIGLVIAVISAVVFVVANETKVEAKVENAEARLDRQSQAIVTMQGGDASFKSEVIDRLARIETEIRQLHK